MPEPFGDLSDIAPLLEQERGARMPQRVETDPRHSGLLCRRHERVAAQFAVEIA